MLALAALLLASTGAWAQNSVFATPQPVGVISSAQSVTVTASATGTVATVDVLTVGASSLDFVGVSSSSTCAAGLSFTSGVTTCTESVTFTPKAPGLRIGAVVLRDNSKNVLGTTYLSGTGLGGLGVLVPGNLVTVAGVYQKYGPAANGIATQTDLDQPAGIVIDGEGNLYIADSAHNQIRMVCGRGTSGTPITTIAGTSCPGGAGYIYSIAGTGDPSYTGDGASASAATLSGPSGVALDGAGNLYIADSNNNVIRMISAATGFISTVVGSLPGTAGYLGDNGPATSAQLNSPQGVTVDSLENL